MIFKDLKLALENMSNIAASINETKRLVVFSYSYLFYHECLNKIYQKALKLAVGTSFLTTLTQIQLAIL